MNIPVSWIKWALIVIPCALAIHLFLLWQPERQIELRTANLLKRASSRDWPAVRMMMGEDYRDGWGHDREGAIADAMEVFSQFFVLHIVATAPMRVEVRPEAVSAVGPVGVFGSGTAIATVVMDKAREVNEDYVFRWRKSGIWPWQWALVEVDNKNLPGRADF